MLAITLIKYPVFRFAADYAAITQQSLVAGYARRGKPLLIVLAIAILLEGIGAVAGVSLVTSGIAQTIFGTQLPDVAVTAGLLVLTGLIVYVGRYQVVENITKVFVAVFSILTIITAVATLPLLFDLPFVARPLTLDPTDLRFTVAVAGWMPIGNVAALMLAAWVIARGQQAKRSSTEVRTDFHIGYFATLGLAACFVMLGTATLLNDANDLPSGSVGFAAMLISLFSRILGTWAEWLIGITALAVMYSTLLTIMDGFPRLLLDLGRELGWRLTPEQGRLPAIGFMVVAPTAVLLFFLGNFSDFIDLITTIAFLIAPFIALGNHLLIMSSDIPIAQQPKAGLRYFSLLCIVAMAGASVGFIGLV